MTKYFLSNIRPYVSNDIYNVLLNEYYVEQREKQQQNYAAEQKNNQKKTTEITIDVNQLKNEVQKALNKTIKEFNN